MDDNKSDIDLPEEATGKQGDQIDRDHEGGEDAFLDEVAETEQQEALSSASSVDYVGGDIVLQDKVENRIVANRYIEHHHEINETEYAEADGSDTPPLIFHEESESGAPIIDYSDVLSQLLVNDETGMAYTPDGVPIPATYVHGDVVFGDKISGNKIISAVYIERQTIINRTLVDDIEGRPPDPGEPPYKGLQSYTENDADLFFGREQLTAELIQRLIEPNFLAVIGASGSGKSSVVRAGVVPALAGQKHANIVPEALAAEWTPYIFSPSQQPLRSLAAVLFPDQDQQSELFSSQLLEDDTTLLNRLRTLSSSAPILLVIDQFEELFTLDESQDRSPTEVVAAFVRNLVTAVTSDEKVNFKIIITLRSDFYTDCLEFEALHELLERHQKIISHMNRDEMREAIIQPAAKERWKIQEGLVELILEDVGEEPGRLPLLSHALLETWKRRRMRVMTLAGYQKEAGGVKGAIAQTAKDTYQQFTEMQQEVCQRLFERLTAFSGQHELYTRRRITERELIYSENGLSRDMQIVVDRMVTARLLTKEDEKIEVAHEALIREWDQLHSWLEKNREGLIIHRRLTVEAETWEEKERDSDFLFSGLELEEAEAWRSRNPQSPNTLENEFLNTSVLYERRRKRNRRWLQTGSIVTLTIIAMLIIGAFFLNNQRVAEVEARATAEIAEDEANVARATAEAARATAEVAEAIAATQAADEFTARTTAVAAEAVAATRAADEAIARATAEAAEAIAATQAANEAIARVTAEAAEAEVRELKTIIQASQLAEAARAELETDPELALMLATSGLGTNVQIDTKRSMWDALATPYRTTLYGHTDNISSANFSPDGTMILIITPKK